MAGFDPQAARDAAADAMYRPSEVKPSPSTPNSGFRPVVAAAPATVVFATGRPAWFDDAACRGLDTNLFFPTRGGSSTQAKMVCQTCPVSGDCESFAAGERFGVWGGLSEKQRQRARKGQPARTALKPIVHGTNAGWQAHIRRGETPCDECRHAHNRYHNAVRRERRRAA